MRFLKNFLFGCLLTISFQYPLKAQDIITTDEIAYVFHHYGVDSALSIVPPFCKLQALDSALAVSMALEWYLDKQKDFEQYPFLSNICSSIRHDSVNAHCLKIIHRITEQEKGIGFISQVYLQWIVFQNNPASIPALTDDFNFWAHKADSIHEQYPSRTGIVLQRLNGGSRLEKAYSGCMENCYKIAWTLYKLNTPGFTLQKVDSLKKQHAPYLSFEEMRDNFFYKHPPPVVEIFYLNQPCTSINDLVKNNSTLLKTLKENYTGIDCHPHLIVKENKALFTISCEYGTPPGSKLMLLEVNGTDQLIVTTLRRQKR